ncbi:FKBP-type peptidyl-prolyl cis-trans isomerase [Pedobacter antarcticus]|uniref:FKBP-type peptidyl-prolyl cis-trans isomerase n=1 Tax=Pedobacter antarcticus TaxID=34086 RepID=UPI00292E74A9|nr:FKBP-type peptidyl-prolyl cis-trans isomerase [Pedobacter antarcticus]
MKKLLIGLLIPFCGYTAVAQTKTPVKKAPVRNTASKAGVKSTHTAPVAAKPMSTLDSASYAFGTSMAASLKSGGLTDLNYDLLVRGLKETFSGKQVLLNQEDSQRAIANLFQKMNENKFSAEIEEGKAFLQQNGTKEGIKTTASGLQYEVITPGTGISPKSTDTVLVNYKGTLLNGKQFDSSYDRNAPLSLSLDRVITGWTEGMQLMQTGAKYRFFIPYQLAYGERGAGADIPPYSALIFEIELLKVNGK